MRVAWVFLLMVAGIVASGCRKDEEALVAKSQTFAELRTIKRGVTVTLPDGRPREPYTRERLVDGETIDLRPGALAWLRRDGGATLLVAGPASLKLRAGSLDIRRGKAFVDAPPGQTTELSTPRAPLHLSAVRTSIEVAEDGSLSAYVLRGGVRTERLQAAAGERLKIAADGKSTKEPVVSWNDWTGGLATMDRTPEPAPFGVGTVGARKPGENGKPRFPLAIQRMDVRVTIVDEFATTEVEQIFANPTGDTVEGLYGFRTPEGATLHRFGVDRGGEIVWGRVKEKQSAEAQYQAHVYEGSTEDPALLVWDSPGVYKARLYPIEARETRRVVVRYAEWLGRHGERGERRLYVYPMAAEGAEATLPRIEELTITLDLSQAKAKDVRVGMEGKQAGKTVTVKAHDFVPRADFSVELYDGGASRLTAYRAPHTVDVQTTAADELEKAKKAARREAGYVLVPVRPTRANEPAGGLDLAIVVDTSAATDSGALAVARLTTGALLAHLGPEDRAAVWAGDATLRQVTDGSDQFRVVDDERREAVATGLAKIERGGATDLGAIVAEAASRLDANRRGAVVYIGDGLPTVGERETAVLRDRFRRLPRPTRFFGIGVGDDANLSLLSGIARGGFAVRVGDGYSAGLAALRVLESAEQPVWLGAKVDLGPGIDRVFPRELGALVADESRLVVGRVVGPMPNRITVEGSGGKVERPLFIRNLDDGGDLRRRWAEGRLVQLLDEGAGRAAVVEVGVRSGIITPFTSLYVPTADERRRELDQADEVADADDAKWWQWFFPKTRHYEAAPAEVAAYMDNEEGGTGTRAKGEEGSMGAMPQKETEKGRRYAVQGPKDDAPGAPQAQALAKELDALEFGMQGLRAGASGAGAPEPASPPADMEAPAQEEVRNQKSAMSYGDRDESAPRAASRPMLKRRAVLSGRGSGGGGLGEDGIGLGASGTLGKGAGSGQGFGSGHGRLGGSHRIRAPQLRMGAVDVQGRLPKEVVQRIIRQNYGRFRMCYERGLSKSPTLQGSVTVRFTIGNDGSVANVNDAGSSLPDHDMVRCVLDNFGGLTFPPPEGGIVTVRYPIQFSPGDAARPVEPPSAAAAFVKAPDRDAPLGRIGHTRAPCSPSADLPFEERRRLWLERLGETGGSVDLVANVYYSALGGCEASTWRERTQLLVICVHALVGIGPRVQLWRHFRQNRAVADVIYRAILTRVHTAKDLRELHEALGIKRMDRTLMNKVLAERKAPAERARLLHGLVEQWPDDLELALELLFALEDAGDDGGGRALARRLRRRSDATTRLRTAVGEYYLRLAERSKASARDDVIEARRTFGEIVEFSPEDPHARRLLGDLLRAHGWFEEALRQYETLARLVPDDTSVPLLLAAAAEGLGRTEEAVKRTEKAASVGSPDPASPTARTARAFASVFLAWARAEAQKGGRKDEAARLRERARRLTALDAPEQGSVRFVLTWAHPELRPELWSSELGTWMPAGDGDPSLGLAQTVLSSSGVGQGVQVHLAPDDLERAQRLGAEATLTAIADEGTESEKIARLPIRFSRDSSQGRAKRLFRFEGGALREEAL